MEKHRTQKHAIEEWLIEYLVRLSDTPGRGIDVKRPFLDYGLRSATAKEMLARLGEWLGRTLSPTLTYDFPNIDALAGHLAGEAAGLSPSGIGASAASAQRSLPDEPIAIIGMGCRYPKAKNPEEFWAVLKNGVDAITERPASRSMPTEPAVSWGGFVDDVDQFDPGFFGISAREAETLDPQQRLLMEVSWEALEDAGIAVEALAGSQTGVFIGIWQSDYHYYLTHGEQNLFLETGTARSVDAGRLSYLWDLHGPCQSIDTACSSSLVALHGACQSLRAGESDLVLAGGVNLILHPGVTDRFFASRMLSPGGRCKTFDRDADGYVRSEGCGVLVLKRREEAIRDGDRILALIRGSAINHDGRTNGLVAPNGPAQQAVVRRALANARVEPREIGYVEAHGTGTPLGDPIEFNALKEVLMPGRAPEETCYLGSVKTNIGHAEAAAGVAGVIKIVLALAHGEIPPHINLREFNSLIPIADTLFSVPREPVPWTGEKRIAGVSSFGISGANAHMVLEAAPAVEPAVVEDWGELANPNEGVFLADSVGVRSSPQPAAYHLLTLSAKSVDALRELAGSYAAYLDAHPDISFADVCYTAATGRAHLEHRLALVAVSPVDARERLHGADYTSGVFGGEKPRTAFLFTGQGSQYVGMGRRLYETEPLFRETLARCDAILRPLAVPLLDLLYGENADTEALNQTIYTQPALFSLEYALARLWQSWGVTPDAVMGHSVGEYVAACIAGVFPLEDALKLIAARGRLMQTLCEPGAMLALQTDEARAQELISPFGDGLSLAAINGPASVVVSGKPGAMEALKTALVAKDIKAKALAVSHAFHSGLMEPMLAEFEKVAGSVTYAEPGIPLCSNVTGKMARAFEVTNPAYWVRHVREPVRFAAGIKALHGEGIDTFLEVGPKPALLGMAGDCLPGGADSARMGWLPSLREGQDDWRQLLLSLGQWHIRGGAPDWRALEGENIRRKVSLPTYPFQRQRYWIDGVPDGTGSAVLPRQGSLPDLLLRGDTEQLMGKLEQAGGLSAGARAHLPEILDSLARRYRAETMESTTEGWFHEIQWRTLPRPPVAEMQSPGSWLILADTGGLGERLATRLEAQGNRCVLAYADAGTTGRSPLLDPTDFDAFQRLFNDAFPVDAPPLSGIVYLWALDAPGTPEITTDTLLEAELRILGGALHLTRAAVLQDTFAKLWLVTRNGIATGHESEPVSVVQSPLWGLGKVIGLEHPEFGATLLDIDFAACDEFGAESLLREIQEKSDETQIALRENSRYGARLAPHGRDGERLALPEGKPYRLQITRRGTLDNLEIVPVTRRSPKAGEVEIRVRAFGLNFLDVVNALGLLPGNLASGIGGECAGEIVAIGDGVEDFTIGDQVMALTPDGFGQYVTTDAVLAVPKPEALGFEEAATIPIVFLTAYYTLHRLANLSPGDKVLIHAAAGGVGLAAIQLARLAGAEVFATASPPKWGFLRSLGITHVMNSRTTDFADEIMALTGGEGVDVVLNSLTSEGFIEKGLSVLKKGGRFLEISKVNIWQPHEVARARPDVSYSIFDLARMPEWKDVAVQPTLHSIGAALRELGGLFREGRLSPLTRKAFPITRAVDAFRYMQQARHTGKIILTLPAGTEEGGASLHPDASYLITGGLGGLGLAVARWMVEKGARHLVLTGRREPSGEAKTVLRALEREGARVLVASADVADGQRMAELFREMAEKMPPLKGVIHAAGVLDIGLLREQTLARFDRVLAAKVAGGWILHTLTRELPLDFFVCFSSVASLLGLSGQANYAAANVFLDALAHFRADQGLPGLSIGWGPWSGAGMATDIAARGQDSFAALGVDSIDPEKGTSFLDVAMGQAARAHLGVFHVDWAKLSQKLYLDRLPPFLSELVEPVPVKRNAALDFIESLKQMPQEKQRSYVATHIQSEINRVLGFESSRSIDLQKGFFTLGMDSLMVVEFQNRLQASLGQSLPSTLLFKYPTPRKLVDYVASDVLGLGSSPDPAPRAKRDKSADFTEENLAEMDQLSEEDVAALFDEELSALGLSGEDLSGK